MDQNSFEENNTKRDQIAARGLSRPSVEDRTETFGIESSQAEINSPRRFSNIKSRLIGFIGAILIGLMVYNLLANYLGLV